VNNLSFRILIPKTKVIFYLTLPPVSSESSKTEAYKTPEKREKWEERKTQAEEHTTPPIC
jgi:hypothetical protein